MKNSFLFVLLPLSIFLSVSRFVRLSLSSDALIIRVSVSLSLTVSVSRGCVLCSQYLCPHCPWSVSHCPSLPVCLSHCPSLSLTLSVSPCLSLTLSVSPCLSLSLSVSHCLSVSRTVCLCLSLSRRCVFAIMSMVYTNRSVSPLSLYLFIFSDFRYIVNIERSYKMVCSMHFVAAFDIH